MDIAASSAAGHSASSPNEPGNGQNLGVAIASKGMASCCCLDQTTKAITGLPWPSPGKLHPGLQVRTYERSAEDLRFRSSTQTLPALVNISSYFLFRVDLVRLQGQLGSLCPQYTTTPPVACWLSYQAYYAVCAHLHWQHGIYLQHPQDAVANHCGFPNDRALTRPHLRRHTRLNQLLSTQTQKLRLSPYLDPLRSTIPHTARRDAAARHILCVSIDPAPPPWVGHYKRVKRK
jgi:hypothetical protein